MFKATFGRGIARARKHNCGSSLKGSLALRFVALLFALGCPDMTFQYL
ncbi:MAG: hypothetical protein LBB67_06255 [Oscillospiraceae bacterium]|jgi:hypothetical protein|nr:hypothetical protein [Oscillospiraceae bacterium]